MNRQEFEEIRSMVERANANLEEIRDTRTKMQNNLRQLDLNEAGWLGALEALSPFIIVELKNLKLLPRRKPRKQKIRQCKNYITLNVDPSEIVIETPFSSSMGPIAIALVSVGTT